MMINIGATWRIRSNDPCSAALWAVSVVCFINVTVVDCRAAWSC